MRPRLPDIATPPFPPGITWLGTGGGDPLEGDRGGEAPTPRMERLAAAGPVLVHFFDFAQLNSVRVLPYVRAWHGRYAGAGLAVLGVHSPRYPFTTDEGTVRSALERLEVGYPVAADAEHRMWRDYGCEGWPSLFLWGRGGTLRWFHFGEGEYRATEETIQALVRESSPEAELPEPLPPLRPTDAPGALVVPPSEELFPGGSASEPWQAGVERPALELEYAAGGAYAAADGEGEMQVALDRGVLEPIVIEAPGLHELAAHERHEEHSLIIRPSAGVRIWSISFAPGIPR